MGKTLLSITIAVLFFVTVAWAGGSAIGFGLPFVAYRQVINSRFSGEVRTFYWDGQSYIGGRAISRLGKQFSLGLELDYQAFGKKGIAGEGYCLSVPLILERPIDENWFLSFDLGPALQYSKENGLNLSKTEVILAFNLGLYYYIK